MSLFIVAYIWKLIDGTKENGADWTMVYRTGEKNDLMNLPVKIWKKKLIINLVEKIYIEQYMELGVIDSVLTIMQSSLNVP